MEYQKTAEATGDLVGNKIIRVSKNYQKNHSEIVANDHNKEIKNRRKTEIY